MGFPLRFLKPHNSNVRTCAGCDRDFTRDDPPDARYRDFCPACVKVIFAWLRKEICEVVEISHG